MFLFSASGKLIVSHEMDLSLITIFTSQTCIMVLLELSGKLDC